jgi:hypothetical protein
VQQPQDFLPQEQIGPNNLGCLLEATVNIDLRASKKLDKGIEHICRINCKIDVGALPTNKRPCVMNRLFILLLEPEQPDH